MRAVYRICVVWAVFVVEVSGNVTCLQNMANRTAIAPDTLSLLELTLPDIPKNLTVPSERASFLLAHFWDAMDFGDTLRSRNRAFVEQNFVNFISLFPHANSMALAPAVKTLVNRAEKDPVAYHILTGLIKKYLYEYDSPMRDEDYFILFLSEVTESAILNEYDKERFTYLLNVAKKNRIGTRVADFTYLTREGKQMTLYDTPAEKLLLIFYDPDCRHCIEVMEDLNNNALLKQLVKDKKLMVAALYADEDRTAWNRTKNELPVDWIVGFDLDNILEKELFVLPDMPTIYLLDNNKTVIIKEASLQKLYEILGDSVS